MNKKISKTTRLWTRKSVGGAKRIWIQNRNLQTKITIFLCVHMLLLVHGSVVFKIFLFLFLKENGCKELEKYRDKNVRQRSGSKILQRNFRKMDGIKVEVNDEFNEENIYEILEKN